MSTTKKKTIQLDSLFNEWENTIKGYQGRFVRDGIVDEELYEKSGTKILFIGKEPNNPDQDEGDFRTWWREDEITGIFSCRIAEWTFGILNGFPQYNQVWKDNGAIHKALHQIAFMNIKKIGGSGISKDHIILEHLDKNLDFLSRQLEIISPDVIVLGTSQMPQVHSKLFPKTIWIDSGYATKIGKFKNTRVIDFCHPSSRGPSAALYSLLQNILQSSQYEQL